MSNEVAVIPYSQLERMAGTIAKSGLFAVKTPEAALTLMLVAQSENIHPAQAMSEYDLIQGKPALKASALLSRFQRSGGKIEWIERTDEKVSARFTHPMGGTVVITWDDARVKKAGLDKKEMHLKFPQQMKSARCISEGVRATFPGATPANLYVSEEVRDMEEVQVISATQAVESFAVQPIEQDLSNDAVTQIIEAPTMEALKSTFAAAYTMAKEAKDDKRMSLFKSAYDSRRDELMGITNV